MDVSRFQRTISASAAVEGFGYWSGRDVRVEFRPAPADCGVVFVRSDQNPQVLIAANIGNRIESPRRTILQDGGARVEMVEHILAALAGLQIDNCEVWIDAAEAPGCDGSSLPFVEALDWAGVETQAAPRACMVINQTRRLGNENSAIETRPSADGNLTIGYQLDYGSGGPIGRQSLSLPITPDSFRKELAPSRTFLLKEEALWLQSQGLGLRATSRDLLVFDDDGPMENKLRYADECVRHKILDVLGDFALAGCDIVGQITAYRSGHRLNAEMVSRLVAEEEIAVFERRCA